jgi:hypothetical protein
MTFIVIIIPSGIPSPAKKKQQVEGQLQVPDNVSEFPAYIAHMSVLKNTYHNDEEVEAPVWFFDLQRLKCHASTLAVQRSHMQDERNEMRTSLREASEVIKLHLL